MPAKPSRYAAALDAALVSADQVADHGVCGEAQGLYNALWTEQGGKLTDEYRLPWEEMCAASARGDRGVTIRAATEFLLAIEFGFCSPEPAPSESPNDASHGVDTVTITRE
jgi:hypothetical protein